jgi:hypothetical protein
MSDGTEPLYDAIGSMQKVLKTIGRPEIDWGVNKDGWEFLITNKFDKPVVLGKVTPADNVERIARMEIHFSETVVSDEVAPPADTSEMLENLEIPPDGTAKIKGSKGHWLTDWPAACAFWFKEPDGETFESWCSISIDISTSILELGAVTRSTSTGLGSPLEAVFPPQDPAGVQRVYLQRV